MYITLEDRDQTTTGLDGDGGLGREARLRLLASVHATDGLASDAWDHLGAFERLLPVARGLLGLVLASPRLAEGDGRLDLERGARCRRDGQ